MHSLCQYSNKHQYLFLIRIFIVLILVRKTNNTSEIKTIDKNNFSLKTAVMIFREINKNNILQFMLLSVIKYTYNYQYSNLKHYF